MAAHFKGHFGSLQTLHVAHFLNLGAVSFFSYQLVDSQNWSKVIIEPYRVPSQFLSGGRPLKTQSEATLAALLLGNLWICKCGCQGIIQFGRGALGMRMSMYMKEMDPVNLQVNIWTSIFVRLCYSCYCHHRLWNDGIPKASKESSRPTSDHQVPGPCFLGWGRVEFR